MRSPWVQICSTMVHRSPCDTRSSSTEWEVRDMASEQSARVRDASLSESTVEDVALDWLASLGWAVAHGPDIAPDTPAAERADCGTVVLTNRLRSALARLNPKLPDEALEDALRRLTRPAGATLEARNRDFHRMLVAGVPRPKLVQRPKVRPRSGRQITERQVLSHPLFQTAGRGHAQRVGIQPHFQQQDRVIGRAAFLDVAPLKRTQFQPLHDLVHKKTDVIFSQHLPHAGRQQIRLLRVVGQEFHRASLRRIIRDSQERFSHRLYNPVRNLVSQPQVVM